MKKLFLFLFLATLGLVGCQTNDLLDEQNAPIGEADHLSTLWLIKEVDKSPSTKAVGVKSKYWNPGDVIRIKFLSGDADFQAKVKEHAAIWLEYANLKFEYVSPIEDADVKIGFGTEDRWVSWSTIGTDCKLVPQNVPSLNFTWWDGDSEPLIKSEILRGFGHVLGLGFEHKNPNSNVVFKSTADIAGEYNLSPEEVEDFKQLYTTDQTNYTEYDKSSIMTLTIGRSLVMSPNMATTFNSELSETDKQFIARLYPVPEVTLTCITKKIQLLLYSKTSWESFKVDWGDGVIETLPHGDFFKHTYTDSLEHFVQIYGCGDPIIYFATYDETALRTIDVTQAKGLERLHITAGNNTIESLNLSENHKICTLHVEKCDKLQFLNITNKSNLKAYAVDAGKLSNLDLTGFSGLTDFFLSSSLVTSLDFSPCPNIKHLGLIDNKHLKLENVTNINWSKLQTASAGGNDFPVINFVEKLPISTGAEGAFYVKDKYYTPQIQELCDKKRWKIFVEPTD